MVKRIALSWSGGKDSCLALDSLVNQKYELACLVTTVPQEMGLTFAHGEKIEMIERQSGSLSIPVHFIRCTFESYTEAFIEDLIHLKQKYQIEGIAFGDIYLDGHREWGEKVAVAAGLQAIYPLWIQQEESLNLLKTFINSGYKATVIRVREDALDDSWLGHDLDAAFFEKIRDKDICPLGENGEYHTFVYDGPLFQNPIQFTKESITSNETSKRLEIQPID
ncbi:diphthine--ammonia ligase [Bacillus aerolatus]|uniref:Diphthine--ammonia ligase n=1 Tax=Bacillus aerolatus TaxID=2653354 RepID=A0A6I1FCZ2_9BACI|nr:diphthine--ammonia ligase [Bacillus aerolatus]KAB7705350.1 diphthine--ammonia ligase [Bacillus aerolatus]